MIAKYEPSFKKKDDPLIYSLVLSRGSYSLKPVSDLNRAMNRSKANALVYLDENRTDVEKDSSMYLARELAKIRQLDVYVTSQNDADLASKVDIVAVRYDPPIKSDFLNDIEKYDDGSRVFVNSPKTQRYFGDKSYLLDLQMLHPEIVPEMIVSNDYQEIGEFVKNISVYDDRLVIKPLNGHGGKGVERIEGLKSRGIEDILTEVKVKSKGDLMILQKYIEGVEEMGDKRITLAYGEPVGAVLRYPKKGDFKCNYSSGGDYVQTRLEENDYRIIDKVNNFTGGNVPWLGIDVIGPYLGEINGVSPGLLYSGDEMNQTMFTPASGANYLAREIYNHAKKAKGLIHV